MSKYGVFSGPYFPVFGMNTGKYGPEKTHAVIVCTELTSYQIFQLTFNCSKSIIET